MKKFFVAIITLVMAVGCLSAQNRAQKQRFSLNMGDFGSLRVIDNVNVEYSSNADSAGYIVFECEPDLAPQLLFGNDKFTLKIQVQDNTMSARLPKVKVYSTHLASVENSGDSTVLLRKTAPVGEISLRVVGNGRIIAKGLRSGKLDGKIDTGRGSLVLGGEADMVKLRTIGTGSIQAGALKAREAGVIMSGTGSVDCWVTDELSVKGLASGKVYVKGSPKVKNRSLGSIKVIFMDQKQ